MFDLGAGRVRPYGRGQKRNSPMLLQAKRAQLVVVDIQERLMPAIHDGERVAHNARRLIAGADALGVPILVTEQHPEGLGGTVGAVRDALPGSATTFPKITFSAAADEAVAGHVARHAAEGRDQLVLCGAEAHVCVLQTALGFRMAGRDVAVVADAVSSRSPHSVSAATARLLHAGCLWVTTEMVLFEWLERAGTDDFRRLLPLIKAG